MSKISKRFISFIGTLSLLLGLFAFEPSALAAITLTFNQEPPHFINVSSEATMDFFVKLSGYEKSVDINMNIYAIGFDEPLYQDKVSYQSDGTKKFSWDGKSFGQDMPPGDYKAVFSGLGISPISHPFKIVPNTAKISFDPVPASQYFTGVTPYEAKVTYVTQGGPIDVKVTVGKLGDFLPTLVETHTFNSFNETHTYKWNGKIGNKTAEPGNYRLFVIIGNQNSATLTKDFVVKNEPGLSFETIPKATLNVKKGELLDFPVKLNNFDQNVDIHFDIQPQGENAYHVKTMQYVGNTTKTFQWDGEHFGEDVSPGEYAAIFYGDGIAPLTHTFHVLNAEPILTFDGTPPAQLVLDQGNYKVSVVLSALANPTTVEAKVILGQDQIPIPLDEYIYQVNGTHEFSWDMSSYGPGTYSMVIEGKDSQGNITNTLNGEFTVVEKAPMLSFVEVPPTTYSLGQSYKANVELKEFISDTSVDLFVYKKNTNPVVFTKAETYVYKAPGKHEFTWDGKFFGNQAGTGDYEVRILGQDLEANPTNILTQNIQLLGNVVLAPNDSCAGYKDLKKTDWSCAAAQWAKDAGIMTGQQGGDYFDGYSYLNRVEIAKVALMAHQLYKPEDDYCQGKKPFPDVALGQWYTNFVCLGKNIKMLTGYAAGPDAGKYVPPRPVTIPEFTCVILRPLNVDMPKGTSYAGLAPDQWYSGCTKYAKDHKYFEASYMLPTQPATRFNVVNVLYAMHQGGEI